MKRNVPYNNPMLVVINSEKLANDREAWRDVVVAAKGLNGLY